VLKGKKKGVMASMIVASILHIYMENKTNKK